MCKMLSNKIYIDYLDYIMSSPSSSINSSVRLRFDLLLFSKDILCMSVPACVKLESTTKTLMKLTPFWKNGKIQLVLDRKHRNNPWNYFYNRNRALEKSFSEEQLINHFEYSAYHSPHTKFFYDTYLHQIIADKNVFFIDKIFDTDEMFRRSVISQSENICDKICRILPINQAIHMGKIINDLVIISEDRKSLFQRSAVETSLINVYQANVFEVSVIRRILDKGFSYANGISGYAVPISQITNRLTGSALIPIIKSADKELYNMICNLNWNALYKLSINELWLDFIDHLNKLLLLYRDSRRHRQLLLPPYTLEFGIITTEIVKKLYETAIESLQKELLKIGLPLLDVISAGEQAETVLEYYLQNRHEYWAAIKEINDLLSAIKTYIKSLSRKYKEASLLLEQEGYIITLDYE